MSTDKRLRFLLRTISRNQKRKEEALRDAELYGEKVKRHKKALYELKARRSEHG